MYQILQIGHLKKEIGNLSVVMLFQEIKLIIYIYAWDFQAGACPQVRSSDRKLKWM